MIREATRQDLPKLLEVTKILHASMKLPLSWDEDSSEIQLRNLLLIQSANILIEEDGNGDMIGVIGGPIVPWPYDLNVMTVQEYLTFGQSQELKTEFYKWAQTMGAKAVIKLCVDPSSGDRTTLLGGV